MLHHPFEVTAQMTIDEKDVEDALMVGHEHITLVFCQMLTPFDLHGYQQNLEDDLCPPAPRVIPPEVAVADSRTDTHLQRGHNGTNDHHRQSDNNLIYSV